LIKIGTVQQILSCRDTIERSIKTIRALEQLEKINKKTEHVTWWRKLWK